MKQKKSIQLNLFSKEAVTIINDVKLPRDLDKMDTDKKYDLLNKIDWDFKGANTQYLSHNFHPYPARFIPQIPNVFIRVFTKEGETVVDPFCGCGTTLLESMIHRRKSIGNDLNPLASLISRAKTRILEDDEIILLKNKLKQVERYVKSDRRKPEYIKKLPKRNISNLFNREIVNEISLIREGFEEIKHESIAAYELSLVALSATIWTFVENGKNGTPINFFDFFSKKLNNMITTIKKLRQIAEKSFTSVVIEGDARVLDIKSKSVSLIVTSPPYVNALDYYRVHMYNMLWLGIDYLKFKKHEIGGHSHFINNRFRLLTEYLADMLRSMIEMNRILKNGGHCVIVVGNSSIEYELIESYKHFINFAPHTGFKLVSTYFRNIDVTRKYTSKDVGKINDEYIVLLRKTSDISVKSTNDKFVEEIVTNEMLKFKERVEKVQGTSLRGRKVSAERLKKNIDKVNEAISHIKEDIKIKEW